MKGGSIGHDETTTSLPSPTALAASWNEPLVREIGELLAGEARSKGVDVLLGPTINLHRSPVGGRHFEQFSEDPLLTGRIACAYIEGLQSRGVGGCPKHYVANDSETERQTLSVEMADQPLRELYLAPFERTVREAHAWTVMAAYNEVRGTAMTESDLLTDPLKTAWGFDGVVMSDWYAVKTTVPSARAAMDLLMPGPDGPWGQALVGAVRRGEVTQAAIDDKVRRLLRLAARVGALRGVPAATAVAIRPPQAEVWALVRRASAAGSVLLANDGVLPLVPGELRRLAILGPGAAMPPGQGGGSANLRPDYAVTPLDGLRAALPDVEILTNPADRVRPGWQMVSVDEVLLPAEAAEAEARGEAAARGAADNMGRSGILVRIFDEGANDGTAAGAATAATAPTATLAGDIGREVARQTRPDGRLTWSGDQAIAGTPVLELSTRIVSSVSGKHKIGLAVHGHVAVWIDGNLVSEEGEPPELVSHNSMWADPPYHAVEVALTAGRPIEYRARWRKFFANPGCSLSLAIEKPNVAPAAAMEESERLARLADVVVVVVGTTDLDETEGRDRTSLALQPSQDDLVARVAAANPKTVVVVSAGSPVLMPWRDDVSAILLTWFPGQEAGNALADMLTGRVEPGGRLPTTWPAATADVPILDTRPVGGVLSYSEGLNIGYRAWLLAESQPAFPFGHGLGYTNWTYLDVEPATGMGAGTGATTDTATGTTGGWRSVLVRVRNSGHRSGREVVQLYLARPDSSVERPLLWLGGFAAVEAAAGQTVEVEVPIEGWAVRHWDEEAGDWAVEPGRFEVRVGRSVGDLRLATFIDVEGAER